MMCLNLKGAAAIASFRCILVVAVAGCCALPAKAAPSIYFARATHVTDGDTLWVAPEGGGAPRKLRILGIDAPEICQPGGESARAALSRKLQGRRLRVRVEGRDDYQRGLARVDIAGEDVAAWLVRQGHAWSYRDRQQPGPYAAQERAARRERRGVFADPQAQRPAQFRRQHGACHRPKAPG